MDDDDDKESDEESEESSSISKYSGGYGIAKITGEFHFHQIVRSIAVPHDFFLWIYKDNNVIMLDSEFFAPQHQNIEQ
eukprot:8876316-Ditylum_brightwellii.AAC.1